MLGWARLVSQLIGRGFMSLIQLLMFALSGVRSCFGRLGCYFAASGGDRQANKRDRYMLLRVLHRRIVVRLYERLLLCAIRSRYTAVRD